VYHSQIQDTLTVIIVIVIVIIIRIEEIKSIQLIEMEYFEGTIDRYFLKVKQFLVAVAMMDFIYAIDIHSDFSENLPMKDFPFSFQIHLKNFPIYLKTLRLLFRWLYFTSNFQCQLMVTKLA
jgi:hypothetical protein